MAISLTFILTSTILFGLQPGPILAFQLPTPPPEPDRLVYTTSEGFSSLEPTRGNPWVVSSFYDTLVSYDRERTDRFRPLLVTEVPSVENGRISPDGLTYRFTIRDNSPLMPEDVEYSIERAMIRGKASTISTLREVLLGDDAFQTYCDGTGCYYNISVDFEDIDNAVEADGNDVVFHLSKIYPPFMDVLASISCSILSKAWCVVHGDWPGTEETWEDYILPELRFPPFNSPLDSAAQGFGPFMLERLTIAELNPLGYTYPRI
jgi:peptide/nickel transport system substrate-binding protein